MSTVMKASEFVEKLKDIAENYKTLYVMGCFGAPMTEANKKRYCTNHVYNTNPTRQRMIKAATADTFGFDCVCLIKGVLWGWNGNKNKVYGGATYNSNGVPDIDANSMINVCKGVTTDFSKIEVGEAVWCTGHIGVYIGNGLAVECSPAWKNKVQITAVRNIGEKAGYSARKWTKHGKLPYIDYEEKKAPVVEKPATDTSKVKLDVATKRDTKLSGPYKVTATVGLHLRTGAGTNKKSLQVIPYNATVHNYGYYNENPLNGVKWLYVVAPDGTVGYCSSAYLKKV